MKSFRVTKIVTEIKLESVWGRVTIKKKLPETITHKILETNSDFQVK